jgi:hypothetical protein
MVALVTADPPIFFWFVLIELIVTSAEQTDDTVMEEQFSTDSLSDGAVADAVITFPDASPVIPVRDQAPEVTVVELSNVPSLYTVIVVPFASVDVPLIVVVDVVTEVVVMTGHALRSAGKPVFIPVTGVGKKLPMIVSKIKS